MINPTRIITCSVITGILLSIFLYNLTASAFNNQPTQAGRKENIEDNSLPEEIPVNDGSIDQPNTDQVITNQGDARCDLSQKFPHNIQQWCSLISKYSSKHQIDSDLIAALILQESAGNDLAYSHSGAVGLMQVMPRDGIAASFMCKNGPCFHDRPTINDLQRPEYNIAYGTRMLSNLISHYGNVRDALRAYGPMDVGYSYSDIVLGLYNQYKN